MNRRGFTLLELIIVIIVIGILASIALPKYIQVTEKARTAEAKSALSSLRSSQIRYYAQWGVYAQGVGAMLILDAELTDTGKYFGFEGANAAQSPTYVARATRNTDQLAAKYTGGYNIDITDNGTLSISGGYNELL